jgi:acetate CoA/acetoacetate CoA-transferase alpha subunit
MVEQKWGQRVTLNGKDWLYHTPLRANVSVLEAYQADEAGNLIFHATQNNFNQVMAYAGDYVIASVIQPIVKKGTLNPDYIQVQGPIVDALVQKEVK